MSRRSEPWNVIDRGRRYWYYKLAGWSAYRSTGIEVRRNAKGTATNQKEAEVFASREADKAVLSRSTGPTLGAFLARYYTEACPHCARLAADNRPITDEYRRGQRARLKKYVLEEEIARLPVGRITAGALEDWKQRQVKKEVGTRTINQTLIALSGAFSEAVHRGDLPFNPVRVVSSIRAESQNQHGIFTPAEFRRMFVTEPESWGYKKKYQGKLTHVPAHTFALLIATIGERPSAILRLDWRHYDGETLIFPEVKDRRKNQRVVPLTSYAKVALEAWKEDSVRIGPEDPIFGYDGGGRMGRTWFKKRFAHMMETLGLPEKDPYGGKRVPYSLKYTLETELIDRGANPALVRDLMGHSHQRGEPETILTPVQARYRRKRAEKLKELIPMIEGIFEETKVNQK